MRTTSGAIRIAIGTIVVGGALAACASGMGREPGPGDGVDGGGNVIDGGVQPHATALSIDPPTSELVIDNGAAAHQTFTATATFADGARRDVTAETRFQVDPARGAFAGGELTIGVAGKTVIVAAYANRSATAAVTARIRSVRIDPALPPTAVGLFAGSDNGLAPQIVYPPPDTVMPRNLGDFEVHWTDSHGNNVFEISLRSEFADVRVYVPGGNGLAAQGPMASWAAFRADEWMAAVGSQTAVAFQVRGASSTAPAGWGAAPARAVKLSNQDMDGGLYYWATATAATAIGIFRHDMRKPGQPAEEFLTTNKTDGHCIGCHVLSRDGTKMAITYQDSPSPPGVATMVDVATMNIAPSAMRSNFGTFTPDNTQFLAVDHGVLTVHSTATQAVLATMLTSPPKVWVTHPDLSPDGKKLVYVRTDVWESDWTFKEGQIYERSYDPATQTFGPEEVVVADGANNYYPSWSPDGNWILFTRSGTGLAYDNNNSTIWAVKGDHSQPPVALAAANQGFGITDSWARWAPFQQTLGSPEEPMYWIALSSKRDFGVRLRNTDLPQRGSSGKRSQLWMTPFFPGRAVQGSDPSLPAFRLPFQNLESSNHITQWTERVLPVPPVIE
jgi:hypothetical protein